MPAIGMLAVYTDCPINCQNSRRFLNRLLEAGYWRYKYTGCASGMASATVIHDGEELVGLYFGIWKLNAVGLEESRPDTL